MQRVAWVDMRQLVGRPFVERFALCYRTVVCLSVLSVCNVVYCGQTAGWIQMKLGVQVGLVPGHTVRWGPSSPEKGGTAPNFWPMSIVAKRSPISATAELLFYLATRLCACACDMQSRATLTTSTTIPSRRLHCATRVRWFSPSTKSKITSRDRPDAPTLSTTPTFLKLTATPSVAWVEFRHLYHGRLLLGVVYISHEKQLRRNVYWARPSVCLSVCVCLPVSVCRRIFTLQHGPRVKLGEMVGGVLALLGGFVIGARVSLLWQHTLV